MNARKTISVLLLLLGALLALLPLSAKYSLRNPQSVLRQSLDEQRYLTADEVARMVVAEDSSLQLIDLRPAVEFAAFNIPGSLNIPYQDFIESDPAPYLTLNDRVVLYSNGDTDANYALVLALGLGYQNVHVMKGGLNAWFESVMNSEFSGQKISARENALFETRMRARKLCNEINSLPDSLKMQYMAANRFDPKKLDGGCE
jgi:rhodanese-related sulfurtransferase